MTVTWEQGLLRFEVPPSGERPSLTAQAAYQACGCSEFERYSTPQVWFAIFTDYAMGTAEPNGQKALRHVRQPVWIVLFANVPGAPLARRTRRRRRW